jgi:hypothetical protein
VLAAFTVTSPLDGGPGSLRDAIEQANRLPKEEHTIQFSPSAGDAIVLTGPLPVVAVDLKIEGPAEDPVTIARDPSPEAEPFRIFTVAEDAELRMKWLVLANGQADFGGAILNEGFVALENSVLVGNQARFKGGAIYNRGSIWTNYVRIEDNAVEGRASIGFGPAGIGRGGGIYNDGRATVLLTSFIGNRANREGGAVFNEGTLSLQSSTMSRNVAEGFVLAGGKVPFGRGGGIYNAHTVLIDGSTIVENQANRAGGGIFSNVIRGGSNRNNPYRIEDSTISSSIVADNVGGDFINKTGTFLSLGHNLFDSPPEVAPLPSDFVGVDPLLSSLGDHGGFTPTYVPLPGSPALDSGLRDEEFVYDQRGYPRPASEADIGAVEAHGFSLDVVSGGGQAAPPGSAFPSPLVVSVVGKLGDPVAGGWVTFGVPGSGASAVLSSSTAMIDPSGRAGVRAVAGPVPGTYAVEARAGAGSVASFELTNEGTPPPVEAAEVGAPRPASSGRPAPPSSTQRTSPYRASPRSPRPISPAPLGPIAARWAALADRSTLRNLFGARGRAS